MSNYLNSGSELVPSVDQLSLSRLRTENIILRYYESLYFASIHLLKLLCVLAGA